MNRMILGATALILAIPAMAQVQAPSPVPTIAPPMPIAHAMGAAQTRDQAVAKVREHFAMMDSNRDGFVAGNEMKAMRGHHQGASQGAGGDQPPRNGSKGRGAQAAFDWLDSNRDNMINRSEFAAGRQARGERMGARGGAPTAMAGDRPAMGAMHRMNGGGRMGGGMMRMADLDKDGRISLQEATNAALVRFDRVDANRDGQITVEERQQQRKAMRGKRAG